jgi:vacuolar-type H+-ATPase subunit H
MVKAKIEKEHKYSYKLLGAYTENNKTYNVGDIIFLTEQEALQATFHNKVERIVDEEQEKVLSKSTELAEKQAKEIINKAEKEAERIIVSATKEAQNILAKATEAAKKAKKIVKKSKAKKAEPVVEEPKEVSLENSEE